MTGVTAGHHPATWRGWGSWWVVLRVALITSWTVWAVMAWWSAPRPAEVEQARADIAAGDVAAYQWADSWERPAASSWGSVPTLRSSGQDGPLFVWRKPDGRTYYVVLADAASTEDLYFGGTPEPPGPQTESLAGAVRASVLDSGRPLAGEVQPDSRFLAPVLGLLCLAILIGGPAPAIGTRWYWFWISAGVPFGLGVLAWLLVERPWSRRVISPSEPGVDKRYRGLTGFLISVAASIAVSLLSVLLDAAFDTWVIPESLG